jgi:Family of unknown function (DUF6427)
VIGFFRQKNPGNVFLLLIYALVLKFSIFLHPVLPVLYKEDNYLYRFILLTLNSLFNNTAILYSILTFLLLFAQATLFNRICNYHKLFPKSNYLPGMSYLLVTSLLQDWNHFSAPLLINFIMIWSWYRMIELYNNTRPVTAIFNIGLLTGLATLLYVPATAFLLLVIFALIIMRPFRIQEWLVGFLGFTSPYYFLLLVLYFTSQLNWKNVLPHIHFALPSMPSSIWITLGIMLLIIPFVIGGYFVQNNLNKMLIQVRKSWSLLLVFLIVAVVVILINKANSYENWIVTAVPFAAFHSSAYFYSSNKIIPHLLHWLCFSFVIIMNYLL